MNRSKHDKDSPCLPIGSLENPATQQLKWVGWAHVQKL